MKIQTVVTGGLSENCYVISDSNKNAVVIDPGECTQELKDAVKKLDVMYILITHGHFDHTSGMEELRRLTGAPILISEFDGKRLGDSNFTGMNLIPERFRKKLPRADQFVAEGDVITAGDIIVKVIETPGHTHGSVCYMIGDSVFSGDTLFMEECGRCDLESGNFGEMLLSLKRLTELEGDYDVYPGHGDKTTLSHERDYNPYCRYDI